MRIQNFYTPLPVSVHRNPGCAPAGLVSSIPLSGRPCFARRQLNPFAVFVEALDKCFENVCELDLIFHSDKVGLAAPTTVDLRSCSRERFGSVLEQRGGMLYAVGAGSIAGFSRILNGRRINRGALSGNTRVPVERAKLFAGSVRKRAHVVTKRFRHRRKGCRGNETQIA